MLCLLAGSHTPGELLDRESRGARNALTPHRAVSRRQPAPIRRWWPLHRGGLDLEILVTSHRVGRDVADPLPIGWRLSLKAALCDRAWMFRSWLTQP